MSLNVAGLQTSQKREIPSAPPFAPTSAFNGLSVDPVTFQIVLGQDAGDPGNPATIVTPREIPMDPGTFIEMRAGTIFGTGGLSLIGIANDSGVSGQPFVMWLDQQALNPAANLVLTASTAGGTGSAIQMGSDQGSGRITQNGSAASIPAILRNCLALNSNQVGTNIGFRTDSRNSPGTPGYFTFWGTDGVGVAQEYYRLIPPVSAVLDFPNTAAQTSADLTVAVPGARSGDAVQVGVPTGSVNANSCFTGFVSANDVVTIRFNNYSAAAIDPAAGTFKVGVMRVLP